MGSRVLVVGAGSIGRRHHGNLEALGASATLRGWRETTPDSLARDLAEHDALVIATATDLRLPLIRAAAEAGRPFFVEKPLAFRQSELEQIERLAAPLAERSMLGFMMRYHPAFRALHDSPRDDVFQMSLSIGHDVTQWRENWRFSDSYAARPEGGGVLLDLCHELDMAHCLAPALAVTGVDCQGHARYPGVDMASRITLSGGGISAEVAMDYLTPRLHRRAVLRGTKALRDFDFAAQSYQFHEREGLRALDLPLERNAMFLSIMRDFLALIEGRPDAGNPLMPRLDRALASARLTATAWEARRFIGTIEKEIP